MNRVICIYCSSSCAVDMQYFDVAHEMGREIAVRGDSLIFGGGMTGLMGAAAKAVHQYSGRVTGVIPQALNLKGIVYENCDELIVTADMRERKAIMDSRSDVFVALPGGFGTLEELLEIITLKQLGYHNKPIVILNICGFYDRLLEQFDLIIGRNFAKPGCSMLYNVACNAAGVFIYVDSYRPCKFEDAWLVDVGK